MLNPALVAIICIYKLGYVNKYMSKGAAQRYDYLSQSHFRKDTLLVG